MLAREHLAFVSAYLTSGIQVALVADEHDSHVWVAVLLHLLKPARQMSEGVTTCDVIDEEGTSSTAVVRACDALERLLTSGVPNLQLDIFLLDLDGTSAELDTNCQIVLLTEPLVCELKQQTRLADTYEHRVERRFKLRGDDLPVSPMMMYLKRYA